MKLNLQSCCPLSPLTLAAVLARVYTRPDLYLGWHSVPLHLSSIRAHADHEVLFSLSLRPQNMDVLYKFVQDASDPSSASYTEYMTREEISSLSRAGNKGIKTVMGWLIDSNMKFELVNNGASIGI